MGLLKRYLVAVVGVPGSPAESQRSEVGTYRSESAARQAGEDEWRRILFVHAPHIDRYRVVIERDGAEVGEVPMPEVPADAAPGILDETVTPLGVTVGAAGEPLEPAPADDARDAADQAQAADEAEAAVEQAADDAVAEVADEAADDDAGSMSEAEFDARAEAAAIAVGMGPADDAQAADDDAEPPLETTGEMEAVTDDEPHDAAVTGQQPVVRGDELDDEIEDLPVEMPVPTADVALDPEAPVSPPRTSYAIEDPPDGPVPDDVIARFAESLRLEEERNAERAERERGRER